MKALVIGGGGREHVLAWKIAQSPLVEKVYCAPGNPGIATVAECVDIPVGDLDGLVRFARDNDIALTVVGPEDPLSNGIVDRFAEEGLSAFGPSREAARLEACKSFAKEVMRAAAIPTAAYELFSDPDRAIAYVRKLGAPVVVKADGLAAGKGVTVAHTLADAERAIRECLLDRVFGDAGTQVLIEERLVGEEASILAFCDGRTVLPMVTSQDHKPVCDDDRGPNTGGMGAYSPAPVVSAALEREIRDTILQPCVDEMARRGAPYRGVLYAGLMITDEGPRVIEFNCRFGDPEAQVVLPRMTGDLVPVLRACCEGSLDDVQLAWDPRPCVTVVLASGGYPGPYEKAKAISGLADAEAEGATVFHAGTRRVGDAIVTSGGRVLSVTALGDDIPQAIDNAYRAVGKIRFEGAHFRTDIGRKALRRLT